MDGGLTADDDDTPERTKDATAAVVATMGTEEDWEEKWTVTTADAKPDDAIAPVEVALVEGKL